MIETIPGTAIVNATQTLSQITQSTVFQTVLSGTIVYTAGQAIQGFILEPIKEYKGVVGEIDNQLKFYANVIENSSSRIIQEEIILETYKSLRKLPCDFESKYKQIPFKWLFSNFRFIPNRESASKAAKTLIRVANIVASRSNKDHHVEKLIAEITELRKNLNIVEL